MPILYEPVSLDSRGIVRIASLRKFLKLSPKTLAEIRSRTITIEVSRAIEFLFNVEPFEGMVGDEFTFYGWLYYDEYAQDPIPRAPIELYINDQLKGTTETDNNGYYEFKWTPWVAGTYTAYAIATV